jgi:hypothetical protein
MWAERFALALEPADLRAPHSLDLASHRRLLIFSWRVETRQQFPARIHAADEHISRHVSPGDLFSLFPQKKSSLRKIHKTKKNLAAGPKMHQNK